MIPALATDGPRQRVAESALEPCQVRTIGERGDVTAEQIINEHGGTQ